MSFLLLLIFILLFTLYGIIAKRLKWIYWLNSMNNIIPAQGQITIDWEGYSNVMGNIIAISNFMLVLGWVVFSVFGIIHYFPVVLLPYLILIVWGQYGYAFRRFDRQAYPESKREEMKIKILEYYNLDLVFMGLTVLVIGLKFIVIT